MRNKNSGIVAVYVLILCFFYVGVGLVLLAYHLGAFNDSMNIQDEAQSRLLAQSALQEARYFLMNINPTWNGTSDEFAMGPVGVTVGTYKYTVVNTCKMFQITGNGYVPNSTAKRKISTSLNLTTRNPNPWVVFSDGFESGSIGTNWTTTGTCGSTSQGASVANWTAPNANAKNGSYSALASRVGGSGTTLVARMCTPVYDLSGCDQVVIRFVYKKSGSTPNYLRIYQDSGSGFGASPIMTATPSSANYGRPATRVTVSTGLTSTTKFRFDVGMDSNLQMLYLDDVQISIPYAVYDSTVD